MNSVRVNSSCSTSDTGRANLGTNPEIRHEWGKDREVFATNGTYSWSFVTQIFHNSQPSHGGNRKTFEVMTSTQRRGTLDERTYDEECYDRGMQWWRNAMMGERHDEGLLWPGMLWWRNVMMEEYYNEGMLWWGNAIIGECYDEEMLGWGNVRMGECYDGGMLWWMRECYDRGMLWLGNVMMEKY